MADLPLVGFSGDSSAPSGHHNRASLVPRAETRRGVRGGQILHTLDLADCERAHVSESPPADSVDVKGRFAGRRAASRSQPTGTQPFDRPVRVYLLERLKFGENDTVCGRTRYALCSGSATRSTSREAENECEGHEGNMPLTTAVQAETPWNLGVTGHLRVVTRIAPDWCPVPKRCEASAAFRYSICPIWLIAKERMSLSVPRRAPST